MEVVPGIHAIDAVGAKVFLLEDERLTLVDTGAPGSAGRVLAYLVALGRRPEEVERIVLTHTHFDHVGALPELRRATGALVCVHELEAPWLAGEAEPPSVTPNPLLDQVLRPVTRRPPVPVDEALTDGDVLPVLGGTRVVHAPGHTLGSIALHIPSRRALIAADSLQVRRGRLTPPNRIFSQDMATARRTIARLAEIDVDTLLLSHFRARRGDVSAELAELAGRAAVRA